MSYEDYKFSKDHEWVKVEGEVAVIGISDFAQHSLGDIVFVELPKVGSKVAVDKVFGSVESVKAVSDLISPVSGKVIEINEELNDEPELLNKDAMASWIIKVEADNLSEIDTLLDENEYEDHCKKEG